MRKPRDYDAELKVLDERARKLRTRKLCQLGELVIATGADALPIEMLAGVLLAAAGEKGSTVREAWRKGGVSFFQRAKRGAAGAAGDRAPAAANGGSAQSAAGEAGAQ